jgi:hypothetical protein
MASSCHILWPFIPVQIFKNSLTHSGLIMSPPDYMYFKQVNFQWRWDSVISIVSRLWAGQPVVQNQAGARIYLSPKHTDWVWDPLTLWVPGVLSLQESGWGMLTTKNSTHTTYLPYLLQLHKEYLCINVCKMCTSTSARLKKEK